ncbi:rhomboid family intramembrane serine protease [Kitasatospora sp. NPDC047058]|uniref:rhomboid family intramembrane serine protease n=1 Tax=Kitasatospora sp. NPDC047058 TaxID=3155620 RepID=UPI0033EA195F
MSLNDPSGSSSALDPARMIADARRALFTMTGVMAVIWLLQLVNWLDDYGLSKEYGLRAQELGSLPNIVTSPLLHWNWAHLEANSGPLFVFGFLAAFRGVKKFLGLTALVAVVSELTAWVFDKPNSVGVGASGMVFGYFGYVVLRGIFDRNPVDTLIGVVLGASYAYMVTSALPGTAPGISWAAHLGGLVGGLAGAWIFRNRGQGAAAAKPATARDTKTAGTGIVPGSRADLLKELDDFGL